MPNYNPNQSGINSQPPKWKHLPSKAARVPEIFLEEILEYARVRDRNLSGFQIILNLLETITGEELEQLKLAISSLSSATAINAIPVSSTPAALVEFRKLTKEEEYFYQNQFGYIPSKYQVGIIDWVKNSRGNGCCNAVAGAGKSSSLYIVGKSLQQANIHPNEIKVCVFGKENSKDLIAKFGQGWKSSISTLHSAGWALVKQELGIKNSYSVKVSSKKYRDICNEILRSITFLGQIVKEREILYKLIDFARLNNLDPTPENLLAIAEHNEIEGLYDEDKAAPIVQQALKIGEQQALNKQCFDFTDQLWLPVKWQLCDRPWFKPYKFVLVDECQDLNATQLELVCMLAGGKGRILAVGDPRQAIMGFSGADCDSYWQISDRIQATQLPLSICYRCPRSHIELVKKIFPNIPIEPFEKAKEGTIEQINKNQIFDLVKNGDMILSRKTAPLVALCMKLIANRKNAQIKGRAIGDTLRSELNSIENYLLFNWDKFNESLDDYRLQKQSAYYGRDNEEQLIEALKDKIEAIKELRAATPNARCMTDLALEVEKIFSDESAPITLSTCHRAKGLEGERIFIWQPDDMPMEWKKQSAWQFEQERNLLYVALTRSKSELYICGDCNWYTAPDNECTPIEKQSNIKSIAEAKAQLRADFEGIFKTSKPESLARLLQIFYDDPDCLPDLEECGKLRYTNKENKSAVHTAVNHYKADYYAALEEMTKDNEETIARRQRQREEDELDRLCGGEYDY